jgi:choline dehydrogenase
VKYDIVIVGAGSAGATLAARLSQDPNLSVLLLDEGPYFQSINDFPEAVRTGYGNISRLAGDHISTFASRMNHHQPWNKTLWRGRVMGGSSAINGAFFIRGVPEDFDGWAADGNPEWAYLKVLPSFRRLETDTDFGGDFHGKDGPIPVRRVPFDKMLPTAKFFYQACKDLGYPYMPDINDPQAQGLCLNPVNDVNGLRINTAMAYLNPNHHRLNLTIRGQASVRRILFKGKRAVGVEVISGGHSFKIEAGEVVLSSGAVGSPFLLLHSGVGPAAQLKKLGMKVLHDLPGVGGNLRNHLYSVVRYQHLRPQDAQFDKRQIILRYTSSASKRPKDFTINPDFRGSEETPPELWLTPTVELPASAGHLRLTSSDFDTPPEIDFNATHPHDLERLREGVRLCIKIAAHSSFKGIAGPRIAPADPDLASDKTLDDWILRNIAGSQHQSGTCKMGPASDPQAVVDQYGRVHGLQNLRVCDASIMPNVVSANPNASTIMIGERMSELIPQTLGKSA